MPKVTTEKKFIFLILLMLVLSIITYKFSPTERNYQIDSNKTESNTSNTLDVYFTNGTLTYSADYNIKNIQNSIEYTIQDNKKKEDKHFMNIKAISLLAITLFTYLLIYKIFLYLYSEIIENKNLTISIIELLEKKLQHNENEVDKEKKQKEEKKLKWLIKILEDVSPYNYKSTYVPTLTNLTTIHDAFYKVCIELNTNASDYIILSQDKEMLNSYKNYIIKTLKTIKGDKRIKSSNILKHLEEKERLLIKKEKLKKLTFLKESKELDKISDRLKELKKYLIFEKEEKYKKLKWQQVTEIIEQKAHHSILSDFKNHSLRTKPYKITALNYNIKGIIKENKILDIYYKIYNIIYPLKNIKKEHLTIKIDDSIIEFLEENIRVLFQHKINVIKNFTWKALLSFGVFGGLVIIAFYCLSCITYSDFQNAELFYFNRIIIINIAIILMVIVFSFYLKNLLQEKILLYKSRLTNYISHLTLVMIVLSIFIAIIIIVDTCLIKDHLFTYYKNIGEIFENLLLPSRFETILNDYTPNITVFEVLTYKLIFLTILGYLSFSSINFIIRKYDSIYFSDRKRTLIPPELATISINFLLAIVFLSLVYGTFFNYVINMDYNPEDIKASLNGVNQVEASDTMSNYIPFSIFIAIVGGLLTMATRDLLENYFAGLSLQMDSPYEEHDRITINDSEMLEVKHIGIRADKFYGIKSNAQIIIPHKKLINETIVNFTLPTLDYRHELTIYVPQHDTIRENSEKYNSENRSIPKRAEMVLMLAIFVNTGVKIPIVNIGKMEDDIKRLDINDKLDEFKTLIEKHEDKVIVASEDDKKNKNFKYITQEELTSAKKEVNEKVNEIWDILRKEQEDYDHHDIYHPLSKLFMLKLVESVQAADRDSDHKHEKMEQNVIAEIKSIVASILLSLREYQKLSKENLHHHIDKNFVARKYRMFRDGYQLTDKEGLMDMAKELVHINYYYFMLADKLWKLKDLQDSLYRKREVDSTSIELLDVPRVTTEHVYSGEGTINYWKVTANITLELSEQSNEIVHHINMYIDSLWEKFDLPKYYKIENNKKDEEDTPNK